MKQLIVICAIVAAGAVVLQDAAEASGSIGAGGGKVSPRAAYSQGKSLTYDLLVCNSCPVRRLDRERAETLRAGLEEAHSAGNATANVKALCGEAEVKGDECTLKLEVVHYFLTRRFKLD